MATEKTNVGDLYSIVMNTEISRAEEIIAAWNAASARLAKGEPVSEVLAKMPVNAPWFGASIGYKYTGPEDHSFGYSLAELKKESPQDFLRTATKAVEHYSKVRDALTKALANGDPCY
jgi:hypothetical protein